MWERGHCSKAGKPILGAGCIGKRLRGEGERLEEAKERANIGEGAIRAPSGHLSSGVTGLHYWAATPAAGTFSSTWLVSPGRTVTLAVAI